MPGRTLSHYEILEPIGEGGMGTVYKARDTRLNRVVAIKSVHGASEDRKMRFLQEAQAASALVHPNIVTVHDLLSEGGEDYIVMEFIAGRTLDRAIPKSGLRIDEALKIAIPAAAALTAAHEAGIVHRDVKPSNIMVRDDGGVKVLDFGLAKLAEAGPLEADQATRTMRAQTEEGAILGTISYMSPEQAEGRKLDARSDIFAFGAVLYEMVTGRRAFSGSSKLSTLSAILKEEPKAPADLGLELPRELERIINRCLRKDPERRYQMMKEVRLALEELKEESDTGRLVTGSAVAQPKRTKFPAYAAAAGALAVAAAAILAWRAGQKPPAPPELSLRQITQDAGYSARPALSPDGKFVAYASDRGGGSLDIWVQQIAQGAQPIRLTRDPGADTEPSFSPDGGQIAFRSQREGGGIYVVPTLGGEERLLLRGYYQNPSFSPDGKWVAASRDPFNTKIFVVPATGGDPHRIAGDFYTARFMAWSPDGSKVLFTGSREQGDLNGDLNSDWWLADVSGGAVIPLKVRTVLGGTGGLPSVTSWREDWLFYGRRNLFRVRIDAQGGKLTGPAEQLTRGSSNEQHPSVIRSSSQSGWRIAFGSLNSGRMRLLELPLDLSAGKPAAQAASIFRDGLSRSTPSYSSDGKLLAYVQQDTEGYALRVQDRTTGAERTLWQHASDLRARISPDGSVVAYNPTSLNEKESTIYFVSSKGGSSRKVCDRCGLLYEWTQDGRRIIYRSGVPMRFWTFDVQSGETKEILAHPRHAVHGAAYSPDGRWLAFHLAPGDGPSHIFVGPVRDGRGAEEKDWIPVFTLSGYNARPWWSRDGKVLYFASDAQGPNSIWAQRIDPESGRPAGSPWVVYAPVGGAESLSIGHLMGPAIGPKSIVFAITEARSNIWLAE